MNAAETFTEAKALCETPAGCANLATDDDGLYDPCAGSPSTLPADSTVEEDDEVDYVYFEGRCECCDSPEDQNTNRGANMRSRMFLQELARRAPRAQLVYSNWSRTRSSAWHRTTIFGDARDQETLCGRTMRTIAQWSHTHKPIAPATFCGECELVEQLRDELSATAPVPHA